MMLNIPICARCRDSANLSSACVGDNHEKDNDDHDHETCIDGNDHDDHDKNCNDQWLYFAFSYETWKYNFHHHDEGRDDENGYLLDLLVRHLPLALLLSLLAIVVQFATLIFTMRFLSSTSLIPNIKKAQAKTNFIRIHFCNLVIHYLQLLPMVSHFLQVFRLKLMQGLQIVLEGDLWN